MSNQAILTTVAGATFAAPILEFLQDNDIAAQSRSDDCGGVDPALGFANGTDILVPSEQLEDARRLLAEWDAAAPG